MSTQTTSSIEVVFTGSRAVRPLEIAVQIAVARLPAAEQELLRQGFADGIRCIHGILDGPCVALNEQGRAIIYSSKVENYGARTEALADRLQPMIERMVVAARKRAEERAADKKAFAKQQASELERRKKQEDQAYRMSPLHQADQLDRIEAKLDRIEAKLDRLLKNAAV